MHLWLILITLLSTLFTSPSFAFWEEFKLIKEKDGSVRVQAKFRFKGYPVTIRSTTAHDKDRYIALLTKQTCQYVPINQAAFFFENNNLKRQREGRYCHLYAVSCGEEEWGFLHLGRKKTIGVLKEGIWSCYNGEKDNVLKIWESLQIVQRHEKSTESFARIENRGLARLLPVLDPKLYDEHKQMCLVLGFQLVCRLAREGCRLLPERMIGENKEE